MQRYGLIVVKKIWKNCHPDQFLPVHHRQRRVNILRDHALFEKSRLQLFMVAVAEWLVAAVFAATQPYLRLFRDFQLYRCEISALVAAVTERLVRGLAAGAPPVGSRFQLLCIGGFLCDGGF